MPARAVEAGKLSFIACGEQFALTIDLASITLIFAVIRAFDAFAHVPVAALSFPSIKIITPVRIVAAVQNARDTIRLAGQGNASAAKAAAIIARSALRLAAFGADSTSCA